MQVHRIQSNQRTFGYNVEANRELLKLLSEQPKYKNFGADLVYGCKYILSLEDKLRYYQNRGWKNYTAYYAAALIPLKTAFTNIIANVIDPEYRDAEIKSYSEEAETLKLKEEKPGHWINVIAESLQKAKIDDKAMNINALLTGVLSTLYPEESFNLYGIGQDIANEQAKIANVDRTVDSIMDKIDGSSKLEEKIELGKSKVNRYIPKSEAELAGFDSLAGMEDLKTKLRQKVISPLKDPDAELNEKEYGIEIPRGILLYGPPGCGKTTIVERLSVEAGLPLFKMSKGTFGSSYINATEQNIEAAFAFLADYAKKERTKVMVFIDEMDGAIGTRDSWDSSQHNESQIAAFLPKIDEAIKNNIIVIGATNKYDKIDDGIRGRLRFQYEVPLPDAKTRLSILKMKLNGLKHGKKLASDENAMRELAELTDGFDIRALEDFVNDAKEEAFYDKNNKKRDITIDDVKKAIKNNENKKSKEGKFTPDSNRKPVGFNTND